MHIQAFVTSLCFCFFLPAFINAANPGIFFQFSCPTGVLPNSVVSLQPILFNASASPNLAFCNLTYVNMSVVFPDSSTQLLSPTSCTNGRHSFQLDTSKQSGTYALTVFFDSDGNGILDNQESFSACNLYAAKASNPTPLPESNLLLIFIFLLSCVYLIKRSG